MAAPPRIPMDNLKLGHLISQRSAIHLVLLVDKNLFKEYYEHHPGNFIPGGVNDLLNSVSKLVLRRYTRMIKTEPLFRNEKYFLGVKSVL